MDEYVNIADLEEFQIINDEILKLNMNIIIQNKKEVINYVINSETQNFINIFYNKANSLNLKITQLACEMEESLVLKNYKDIIPLKELDEDSNEALKIELYNYLYWKYNFSIQIGEEKKLKHGNIKKFLKLKNNMKYTEIKIVKPIEANLICPLCGGDAKIKLLNLAAFPFEFKCTKCSHFEKTNLEEYESTSIIQCQCRKCKEIKSEIFKKCRSTINKLYKKITAICRKRYNEAISNKSYDNYDNQKYYEMYLGILSKDEREVLKYQPKTLDDIFHVIDEIQKIKNMYKGNEKYKDMVINKLLEHKILYKGYMQDKSYKEVIKDSIFRALGQIDHISKNQCSYTRVSCEKLKNEIKSKFIDILLNGSEEEFYSIVVANKYNLFSIEDDCDKEYIYLFPYIFQRYLKIYNNYLYGNESYKVNPCYLKRNTKITSELKLKNIKKLFRSDSEKSVYIGLKNEYSDCIIIPNMKLSKVLKLEKLKDLIDDNELQYLLVCECDFYIFDLEGNIRKIIELQKGNHHNNPEWIWKDKAKENAIKMLGVEFEEKF